MNSESIYWSLRTVAAEYELSRSLLARYCREKRFKCERDRLGSQPSQWMIEMKSFVEWFRGHKKGRKL